MLKDYGELKQELRRRVLEQLDYGREQPDEEVMEIIDRILLEEGSVCLLPVGEPRELEEAAAIDGSSFSRTLFSIILPVCKPILVTIGIIQFFSLWNEFTYSLILLSDERLKTISVGLTIFKGQYSTDYPQMMAAMFMAILPAIILYFAFSKQIIKGMVAGAVKG